MCKLLTLYHTASWHFMARKQLRDTLSLINAVEVYTWWESDSSLRNMILKKGHDPLSSTVAFNTSQNLSDFYIWCPVSYAYWQRPPNRIFMLMRNFPGASFNAWGYAADLVPSAVSISSDCIVDFTMYISTFGLVIISTLRCTYRCKSCFLYGLWIRKLQLLMELEQETSRYKYFIT